MSYYDKSETAVFKMPFAFILLFSQMMINSVLYGSWITDREAPVDVSSIVPHNDFGWPALLCLLSRSAFIGPTRADIERRKLALCVLKNHKDPFQYEDCIVRYKGFHYASQAAVRLFQFWIYILVKRYNYIGIMKQWQALRSMMGLIISECFKYE